MFLVEILTNLIKLLQNILYINTLPQLAQSSSVPGWPVTSSFRVTEVGILALVRTIRERVSILTNFALFNQITKIKLNVQYNNSFFSKLNMLIDGLMVCILDQSVYVELTFGSYFFNALINKWLLCRSVLVGLTFIVWGLLFDIASIICLHLVLSMSRDLFFQTIRVNLFFNFENLIPL